MWAEQLEVSALSTGNICQVHLSGGEAKHSNRSCYANLQLSKTIKTIVNLLKIALIIHDEKTREMAA